MLNPTTVWHGGDNAHHGCVAFGVLRHPRNQPEEQKELEGKGRNILWDDVGAVLVPSVALTPPELTLDKIPLSRG